MASERVQRQIDRLLDEAEVSFADRDWVALADHARDVLRLDGENEDGLSFLAAAESALEGAPAPAMPADGRGTRPTVGPTVEPTADHVTSDRHDRAPPEPTSFAGGRYVVERFLGEGGKKRVFLAHDELLDRDVAFALIKTEGLDDVGRERVTREAQAMARLAHPHIVSIFDLGEHEGQPFVVTELMSGGDVEGLVDDAAGPLPLARTLEIATGVASGLVFAHDKGVVHRDLKPGNVWLTADGVAKIGDYGLAVALDKSRLTVHGMMVGTVSYMPPEQALGGDVTPAADLYSLGAMLYELVTGRPPFTGGDATAVISQHISTVPVAPSWQTDGCPAALEALILHLLAKVPQDRPANAADVLARLGQIDPTAPGLRHGDSGASPLERLARGVFVGREPELDKLRTAFDEAFAGRGSLVMLVGEPGIGKTRTSQELATYARVRGAQVLWGRARESAGAPAYWPWIQVGNAWDGSVDVAARARESSELGWTEWSAALVPLFPALKRMIPDLPELPVLHDADAAQFRLFQAYTEFMRSIVADSPAVVILDDLHWADKPSLLLLQHLASDLAGMRLLVVGTYRDTDLARTHPLSEALAELNREPGFLRLALRGLSREETAAYIRATANVEPTPVVLDRIVEETEGNPFFLSEVVNLLTQEGTLDRGSLSDIAIPDGVREALGRRLDLISKETNDLLQVAAVVGREFAYETLTLLGDHDDDVLLTRIEEALDARVIEELDRPGRYRFTHALMQETLLAELSTTRRVRLHGQVGDALERRWADTLERHAPELAAHFDDASTISAAHAQRAVRYHRLAAEQAEAVAAWDDARQHYQRCVDLVDTTESDLDVDHAELLASYARSAYNAGDVRAAWRTFRLAIDEHRAAGDTDALARVTLDALRVYPRADQVDRLVHDALAALGDTDPHLEALLLVELASTALGVDLRTDTERARLDVLCASHDWDDVTAARLDAETTLAATAWVIGMSEAGRRYRDAFERFDRLGQPGRALQALLSWVGWSHSRGLDAFLAAADETVAYARRYGIRYTDDLVLQLVGWVHQVRGDWVALDRARAELAAANSVGYRESLDAYRHWWAGRIDDAIAALPDPNRVTIPNTLAGILSIRCTLLQIAGRTDEAADIFAALRAVTRRYPDNCSILGSALGVMCPTVPGFADDEYLAELDDMLVRYDTLDDPPVFSAESGCILRLFGDYDLARGRSDRAEPRYRDALAWAERERCPIEVGFCHQGLAEIAEQRGDHTAALEHLEAAGALFAAHDVPWFLQQVLAKKEILKA